MGGRVREVRDGEGRRVREGGKERERVGNEGRGEGSGWRGQERE